MSGAPLAFSFAAGMLATVNPCGFSMLPAYLGYFVGLEDDAELSSSPERAIPRALAVSGVMTLGFVAVFGVMGLLITQVSSRIQRHLPWLTIAIGIGLVALGIAALAGRTISVRLPKMQRGTGSRELPSMFIFGVSYAVSSLSCTIGAFLAAVSPTISDSGIGAGVLTFVFYGLGMGAIVMALTVAVSLARKSLVQRFRQLMPYVNRMTGVLLVIVGTYLAYYGIYALRQNYSDTIVSDPIVDRAESIQAWIANHLQQAGPTRVGVVVALGLAAAVGFVALRRARRHTTGA